MAIKLTEAAATHIQEMLNKRGHGLGLRLSTKASGCTGFTYVVDYADKVNENDQVFETYGVKVVVDNKSMKNLKNSEIDYVKENALCEGFEFNNPQVKEMCGCGESFSV